MRYSRAVSGRPPTKASVTGLALVLALGATRCGGGNSSPPPPPPISVTVSPSTAIVTAGNTEQFTATVTGTSNTAVTWSVTGTSSNLGTITSGGLYTAPNPPPTPNMATVKATSQADTNKFASASVTITAAPQPVAVTAGNTTSNVNIAVQQLTPTLELIALGIGNSGGVTGAQVSRGASVSLFLVGKGVVAGTAYQISGPNDIQIIQPSAFDFCTTTDNIPCVNLSITVSSSAQLGPRNVIVTNSSGELAVFVGGLLVT